ncbi:hypothetical protein LZU96_07175 [Pantoea agglomerans]|nr:hypothetical protein [Pantoea agglomerans]UIL53711.1 hypothetical protein LZU96_07175 [Pantoea agglomerans]
MLIGLIIAGRFLFLFLNGDGDGHIQSLILSAVLMMMGFQTILVAFLADLLSANRKLIEDVREKVAKLTIEKGSK